MLVDPLVYSEDWWFRRSVIAITEGWRHPVYGHGEHDWSRTFEQFLFEQLASHLQSLKLVKSLLRDQGCHA